MKEKLKKFFRKFEDLLVYLVGSMSIILIEIAVWSIDFGSLTIKHIIAGTITLSLLILLGMHFIKKGGD